MTWFVVRHQVEDYARWKAAFDEHCGIRTAWGLHGGYVMRSADNPNEVVVAVQADDLAKARAFAQTDDLRDAMRRAGVIGQPEIQYLEVAEELAA
jgi:heme-degrading monooxygenase HmoA